MKIIFLDIDGVMNSEEQAVETLNIYKNKSEKDIPVRERWDFPRPWRLELLKQIVDATGAKVVLSSCWRGGCYINEAGEVAAREDIIIDEHIELVKIMKEYDMPFYSITPWGIPAEEVKSLLLKDKKPCGLYDYDDKSCYDRGAEILYWLKQHPDVDSFVIIDDDVEDLKPYTDRFIKTTWKKGLQPEHVQKAIDILNKDSYNIYEDK